MNQQREQDRLSPGKTLRRARTAKQWSVEEVSQRLKLPLTTIKQLERDDCDFNNIYQRGYALSYAKLLGLELDRFTSTLGDVPKSSSPPPSALTRPPQTHRAERFLRFATYALGTAVVAVPLVWSLTEGAANFFTQNGFAQNGSAAQSANGDGTGQGRAGADGSDGAQSDGVTHSGPTHLSASVAPLSSINNRSSSSGTPPVSPPSSTLSQSVTPANSASNAAASSAGDTATDTDGIVQALTETGSGGSAELVLGDDTQADEASAWVGTPALRLSLQSDSWVEITDATGRRLEYDLLRGGSTHNYQGEAPYRILIGRAIGVRLEHQGEPVDLAPHIRGNVASFELARRADESAAENTNVPGKADQSNTEGDHNTP